MAQGRKITKENLEGFLTNLEEVMEEVFESGPLFNIFINWLG
jgi:hypothetical protein